MRVLTSIVMLTAMWYPGGRSAQGQLLVLICGLLSRIAHTHHPHPPQPSPPITPPLPTTAVRCAKMAVTPRGGGGWGEEH